MQRLSTILLAIFGVVVLAGAVLVIKDNGSSGGQTDSFSAPPTRPPSTTGAASTVIASSTAPTPGSAPKKVVAFLGDDWTSGTGATSKSHRFSTLVTKRLGVTERNLGRRASGYAVGTDYVSRVADVVAAHPAVVVVAGGRNDVTGGLGSAAATNAATLFTELHRMLPDAVLVAVAPMWGDSDAPPKLATLATAVRKAVTAQGGTYLDLPDPIHGHPAFMADGSDPDDQGYTAIADALAPLLAPLAR